MSDWQQRVVTERDELHKKLIALIGFIFSERWIELDKTQQELLMTQAELMIRYRSVLNARIDLFR